MSRKHHMFLSESPNGNGLISCFLFDHLYHAVFVEICGDLWRFGVTHSEGEREVERKKGRGGEKRGLFMLLLHLLSGCPDTEGGGMGCTQEVAANVGDRCHCC